MNSPRRYFWFKFVNGMRKLCFLGLLFPVNEEIAKAKSKGVESLYIICKNLREGFCLRKGGAVFLGTC